VHPIERLRYVARASGGDPSVLVRETAGALASMGFDQAELVTACRRVVDRHLTVGPLWWLCARVLCAAEPRREAWACADEVEADETAEHLAWALPDDALVCVVGWPDLAGAALERKGDAEVLVVDSLGEGRGLVRHLQRVDVDAVAVPTHGLGAAAAAADVVLLECSAVGPSGAVCVSGSRAAAAVARHAGRRVWLVAGVGRSCPAPSSTPWCAGWAPRARMSRRPPTRWCRSTWWTRWPGRPASRTPPRRSSAPPTAR
jgi:hypothetical protein